MVRTFEVGGRLTRLKFRAFLYLFYRHGIYCRFVAQILMKICPAVSALVLLTNGSDGKKRSSFLNESNIKKKNSFAYRRVARHSLKGLIRIRNFIHVYFCTVRYVTLRYVPLYDVMRASLVMHWSEWKKIENRDES